MTTAEIDEFLREIEKSARDRHIPILLGESAEILIGYARELKPKRILEIGTAIGYSGILLLLNSDGEAVLDTVERNAERIEEARINFEKAGLLERTNIYAGDSRDILPTLSDNRYDLIFMDGGKSRYKEDILLLESMLSEDGVIFADNVLFKGKVMAEGIPKRKHRSIVNNLREYLSILSRQDGYETALIDKGDGITVTRKKK